MGSGGSTLSANDGDRHSKMNALFTVVPFWSMLEKGLEYTASALCLNKEHSLTVLTVTTK